MTIVGNRIDGRLIHGQVANLWTTKLNVTRIMVIDDEVAQNDIEKSGLKLATPPGVKLSILPIAKAAENILAGKYDDKPESWFYMVQCTLADQVARDAEAESAEAKKHSEKKAK